LKASILGTLTLGGKLAWCTVHLGVESAGVKTP